MPRFVTTGLPVLAPKLGDRNGRWHVYDSIEPTTTVDTLLTEIGADPTGIFFG